MTSGPNPSTCVNPKPSTPLIYCDLTSMNANTSTQFDIIVNVNQITSGQLINQSFISSGNQDINPDNNFAQVTTTIDAEKPQVTWVSPVTDGSGYFVKNGFVHLRADATDNLGVDRVRFYRWDKVKQYFVEIGTVDKSPYQWDLDTSMLYFEWNEIDVEAYDKAGNVSDHQYIFLFRQYPLYLPFIRH